MFSIKFHEKKKIKMKKKEKKILFNRNTCRGVFRNIDNIYNILYIQLLSPTKQHHKKEKIKFMILLRKFKIIFKSAVWEFQKKKKKECGVMQFNYIIIKYG